MLRITARQYGEVVLPDDSTGQSPGTRQLAGQKVVTVQGGYGTCFCRHGTNFYCVLARLRYKFDWSREFITGYKVVGVHWRSVAVQTVSEPEIYHGAGIKLRADARVRVQRP